MKNIDMWQPSKYILSKNGRLRASMDPGEVGISSRLIVNLVARFYDIYLKQYAKGKLIDLGCGKVPLFAAYKHHVTDIVCVDWENTLHKNDYLDYECDLTDYLPFVNNQFDTIILSDVLEHIPEPEFLWREMARILAPDGKIIMNVPFYYRVHEQPHDYYRYTEFALKYFTENVGLKIIVLKAIGGAPEALADMLAKMLFHIPLLGKPAAIFVQSFAYLFVSTQFGKRISLMTSNIFPLGYFLIAEK